MRIDTKNKIVFFANAKTGSTSLRKLMDKYNDKRFCKDFFSVENPTHIAPHLLCKKFEELHKKNEYIDHQYDEYFSFTTIRNPWARIVSAYNY